MHAATSCLVKNDLDNVKTHSLKSELLAVVLLGKENDKKVRQE